MNQEKFSDSKLVIPVAASTALATGDVNGSSIDTQFYNSLTIGLVLVVTAGQVNSITFEESDDNSIWTDVPTQENLYYPDDFPITASGNYHVGTIAKKRYVRAVINSDGSITGSVTYSLGFLQDSLTKPMVKESSVIADSDVISPDQTADAVTTPPKRS